MLKSIQHLKHHQIDKTKWDACIANSPDGLVYAYSWFLDAVAPGWEALIEYEYQSVMPLPLLKAGPFKFIFQPMFAQQLGVFSLTGINAALYHRYKKALPYKIIRYNLHFNHQFGRGAKLQTNFELPLEKPYALLREAYAKNNKKNIVKATNKHLKVCETTVHEFLNFYQNNYGNDLSPSDYKKLNTIAGAAHDRNFTKFYGCIDENQQWLSMGFFIIYGTRIIYHSGISSPEGYKKSAQYLVLDKVIEHYAGTSYILDFEGSEIESIAYFFKGFGATNKPYYVIENKLLLISLKLLIALKKVITRH
jgi:hypothetical protein